ncbi:unnamed protein product [Polarella glacialis]|uniref:Uncharacterized protein n=2 Tax=Polarella glacialis TaxID=89957 RepID=A0A813F310_POLGL|nr:unnamed protein product [Polarella glacialis]
MLHKGILIESGLCCVVLAGLPGLFAWVNCMLILRDKRLLLHLDGAQDTICVLSRFPGTAECVSADLPKNRPGRRCYCAVSLSYLDLNETTSFRGSIVDGSSEGKAEGKGELGAPPAMKISSDESSHESLKAAYLEAARSHEFPKKWRSVPAKVSIGVDDDYRLEANKLCDIELSGEWPNIYFDKRPVSKWPTTVDMGHPDHLGGSWSCSSAKVQCEHGYNYAEVGSATCCPGALGDGKTLPCSIGHTGMVRLGTAEMLVKPTLHLMAAQLAWSHTLLFASAFGFVISLAHCARSVRHSDRQAEDKAQPCFSPSIGSESDWSPLLDCDDGPGRRSPSWRSC